MDEFVVPRPPPEKHPLLSKRHAVELWYETRRLNQEKRVAIQRKKRYKAAAKNAARRCADLETHLSYIEQRAAAAEASVEQLRKQLAKYETQTAVRVMRQKLLSLIKTILPGPNQHNHPH